MIRHATAATVAALTLSGLAVAAAPPAAADHRSSAGCVDRLEYHDARFQDLDRRAFERSADVVDLGVDVDQPPPPEGFADTAVVNYPDCRWPDNPCGAVTAVYLVDGGALYALVRSTRYALSIGACAAANESPRLY